MEKRVVARLIRILSLIMCLALCALPAIAAGDAPLTLEEQLAPYDPPITLTVGWYEAANVKYGEGEDMNNNRWITKFREDMGIEIKYAWVAPSDQYDEKVNIIIASGDLPDMMRVNSVQLAKCVDNELVMTDLKPLFDKYVTPTQLADYQTIGTEQTFAAATYDGKLAAIPRSFSSAGQGVDTISLRRDWLAAVNAQPPKTFDGLMELYELWSKQDFDGNGKDDTYGIYTERELNSLKRLSWCFGAYPTHWVDVDGQMVYGSVMPQMKDALAKFREMYEKGYIDPEFAVKDAAKANELYTQNRIGSTVELAAPGGAQDMIKAIEGSEFDCYPLPSATDAEDVTVMMSSFGNEFYAIRKGYEHPEAVIKVFCYMTELSYGEAATYDFYVEYNQNYDNNIAPFTWGPWFNLCVEKNYRSYNKFKNNEAYDTMNPEEQWIFDTMQKYEDGDPNQWWMARFFDTRVGGHYLILDDVLAKGNYLLSGFYGAPLESIVEYKGIVDRLFDEMCVKIIMGDEPVDSFDRYVEQMNQAGLSSMTEDVNAWYQAQQGA